MPAMMTLLNALDALRNEMAAVAQNAFDACENDGDFRGNLSSRIAKAIAELLYERLGDIDVYTECENWHTWNVVTRMGEAYAVDISPSTYGAWNGLSFESIGDAIFSGADIVILPEDEFSPEDEDA